MSPETLRWDVSVLAAVRVPEAMLPEIGASAEVHGTAVGRLPGASVASAPGGRQAVVLGQACGTWARRRTPTAGAAPRCSAPAADPCRRRADCSRRWVTRSATRLPSTVRRGRSPQRARRHNGSAASSASSAPPTRSSGRRQACRTTAAPVSCPPSAASSRRTGAPTHEVVDAVYQDSGIRMMQHQADVLGVPVLRPRVSETTCPGAAYAAGLVTGVRNGLDELTSHRRKAVEKSFGWTEEGDDRPRAWCIVFRTRGPDSGRWGGTGRGPAAVLRCRPSGVAVRPGPWRAGRRRRGPP